LIFADAIVAKAKVYSIKEYDEIQQIDFNTTFFTRASYDPVRKVLEPKYESWEKLCTCKKPLNPNLLYIKCDSCNQWFHPECMGLKDDLELASLDEFHCVSCKPADDSIHLLNLCKSEEEEVKTEEKPMMKVNQYFDTYSN
jgi:hypothetical protein